MKALTLGKTDPREKAINLTCLTLSICALRILALTIF